MSNQAHLTLIHSLGKTNAFNLYTLASTESWQRPSVRDIAVVRGLIPLTDVELAHRLDVDERTIRKWKIRPDMDGVHHLVLSVLASRTGDAVRSRYQ